MTEGVDMSAWTEQEIHTLISMWPASSASQIGAHLGSRCGAIGSSAAFEFYKKQQ